MHVQYINLPAHKVYDCTFVSLQINNIQLE